MSVDECYIFKQYTFTDGIFENSIDATYILYLEGSKRITNILMQLEKYHPTNRVYMLMNKGYKNCKKTLISNQTGYDIIDANIRIFNHAKTNNYSNILVLEDDFIFSDQITNKTHINNIESFLIKHKNTNFVYQLGCVPIVSIPYTTTTFITFSIGAHANIYSKMAYEWLITDYSTNNNMKSYSYLGGLDGYLVYNMYKNWNVYMYYKPICYQTFPHTESRSNWDNYISYYVINLLQLDKQVEPGTSILYLLSKVLFVFLVIFILYIFVCIFKFLKFYQKFKLFLKRRFPV
jgi:hypothetical protein